MPKSPKPPKKPKANPKNTLNRLLKLLFTLKHDPKSGFADLAMKTEAGQSLDRLLRKERRYEWKKVGQTEHLFDLSMMPQPQSVAFIAPVSSKSHKWAILGRRPLDGTERTAARARERVETYFEVISDSE